MKSSLLSLIASHLRDSQRGCPLYYAIHLGQCSDQGQNVDIRIPPSNNTVVDVTSTDLTCNVGGLSDSTADVATVPAGVTVSYSGTSTPNAWTDATSFDSQGAIWTKIHSSGLTDASSQQWATDVVNANGGKHSVPLPASLSPSQYLLHAEIIALRVAQSYPGAQFASLTDIPMGSSTLIIIAQYIGCAQVNISGGGSASPPKIALPGTYEPTNPGTVNIYNNLQSYTAPGGVVWSG